MLQVGEVSRKLGLNPQTLYFYERIGLIPAPHRTESGYRLFSKEDIDRLAFITHTKSMGLSLDDIREILAAKDGQSPTCQTVHDCLLKKARAIEETIQQLQILHDELLPLINHCHNNIECQDCSGSDRPCTVSEDPRHEFHQACSTWQGHDAASLVTN
ncbi:MAG: heavy metal-responsive transcriptional regulator [Pseudanabaena frigida]|uniref:Heavy metal-responsive transcriptional regulator n=1 Tax=Pseudanabaena frigida TaxID=945775 RepID=A0A2W4YBS0_9CYAN|nr:MAG: heavy metal-responsive transcriptional regulator [Pseudanabaena frigida]